MCPGVFGSIEGEVGKLCNKERLRIWSMMDNNI